MSKKVVAICACTMGLAHTFMAAESLENAARELGVDIKVQMEFKMNYLERI